MSATSRERALAKIRERDALEAELDGLRAELRGLGADMHESLLTDEGFPRADLDLPAVRAARVNIIRLENDLKKVLDEIAELLVLAFAEPQPNGQVAAPPSDPEVPFCYVEGVQPGSAAEEGGLAVGDKILRFGTVHAHNHNALQGLQAQARLPHIHVLVLRDGERLELGIRPQGRLGCHILPL